MSIPEFGFDGDGFRLRSDAPGALISDGVGASARPVELHQEPAITRQMRTLPLGVVGEQTTRVWLTSDGHRLVWNQTRSADGSVAVMDLAMHNGGTRPIQVSRLHLLQSGADGVVVCGNPADWRLTPFRREDDGATLAEVLQPAAQRLPSEMSDRMYDGQTDPRWVDGRWRRFHDLVALVRTADSSAFLICAAGRRHADVILDWRVDGTWSRLEIASLPTTTAVAPGAWQRSQEVAFFAGPIASCVERAYAWCVMADRTPVCRCPSCLASRYHQARTESVLDASLATCTRNTP